MSQEMHQLFLVPYPDHHNATNFLWEDKTGNGSDHIQYNFSLDWDGVSGEMDTSGSVDTGQGEYADILNFQYNIWSITGTIIAFLGLVGNVMSIPVLANRRMMSPTSFYLIALAVFDSIVLVSLVMSMSLPVVFLATGRLEGYFKIYPYLQPVAYPVALTAQTCSIYTTVGLTVERYIAVCHPLKAGKWCSMSRAKKGLIIIFVTSVMYNVPRMFEYKVSVSRDADNSTVAHYVYTELGENVTYRHVYFIYLNILVMLILPFLLLLVLNALLIRAVRQSARAEGKVTNRQRRENNLTVMLISVVVVFLLCQVLSIIDNIFLAILPSEQLQSLAFVKLTCVSSLMVITNSAINFYLYCMFGKKFRRVFLWLFCSCFQRFTKRLNLSPHDPETTSMVAINSMKHTVIKGSCHNNTPLLPRRKPVVGNAYRDGREKAGNHLVPPTMKYTMVTNCEIGTGTSDETSL